MKSLFRAPRTGRCWRSIPSWPTNWNLLTILGVIIGTGTIIGVGSILTGFDGAITNVLAQLRPNSVIVSKMPPSYHGSDPRRAQPQGPRRMRTCSTSGSAVSCLQTSLADEIGLPARTDGNK